MKELIALLEELQRSGAGSITLTEQQAALLLSLLRSTEDSVIATTELIERLKCLQAITEKANETT